MTGVIVGPALKQSKEFCRFFCFVLMLFKEFCILNIIVRSEKMETALSERFRNTVEPHKSRTRKSRIIKNPALFEKCTLKIFAAGSLSCHFCLIAPLTHSLT
jgi:hypothetical protein